jgi:CRISPR-associated endonuclease/helicase Cas3
MPTVCLSTVDQIGSRLLFRGYGLNEYQWPIHAGLIGSDALLILDEAHLSNPFLETLQAIERYQTWTEQSSPITHPWSVVHMTATPSTDGEKFALEDADYQHAELSKRLKADKLAELQEAPHQGSLKLLWSNMPVS